MLITILGQHGPNAPLLQELVGNDHQVRTLPGFPPDGVLQTDVLITTRLTPDEAGRLQARLLHVPGAGLDAIALEAVPQGCLVCNVYEHELPIAEFITHAILQHQIFGESESPVLDETHWPQEYLGRRFHGEAAGKRVAIIGFGAIGRAAAQRLRALEMHVTAVTRRGTPEALADATSHISQLRSLLGDIDYLVLSCPLTEDTRGLIGPEELALMHPEALLINIGRAPLVDQAALYEALLHRRIGGAVLDVWHHYPQPGQTQLAPADYPFHTLPNVRCTPHISGWTHGLIRRRYALIARNIQQLEKGAPLKNLLHQPA
ncbi:2-hydroxyacid dehydrogenase [Paracandidimonas soli]|uniref:2-hydroxyacid dehydrogenase n=1 Tax=Paracandidimonas soli TaxID=1917182 RepID=UPI00334186E1